jgi:spermidine synthase
MGQADALTINLDELQERLNRPDYAAVAQSLREIGINSPVDLFATYAGQKSDLTAWYGGVELNLDRDLRLQYLGGWGINSSLEDVIYRRMLRFRASPRNLFAGSPERLQTLLSAMARP